MKLFIMGILLLCAPQVISADLKPVFQTPPNIPAAKRPVRTTFDQLINAIENSNIKGIHDLLEQFPDLVDQSDTNGWNPFHYAALSGNLAAAKILGSLINGRWWFQPSPWRAQNSNKDTPAAVAITAGKHDMVKYLVELRNDYDVNALILLTLVYNRVETFEYLFNRSDKTMLFAAIEQASRQKASPEILFMLGKNLDYIPASANEKNSVKQHIQFIFKNNPLPIACEFIRGYESCDNYGRVFPYEELLSPDQQQAVNDFIKYPEKYL